MKMNMPTRSRATTTGGRGMVWTDDELTVLFAIQVNQPFKAGDDSQAINHRIASELGRRPGAIDRQWRNLKNVLYGLADPGNVSAGVVDIVDHYKGDLSILRRDALDAMDANGWQLHDLLD